MQRNQSPFGIERRLTPELFDQYVAEARAERSKAIAAFFSQIAGWPGRRRPRSDASHAPVAAGRELTR